MSFLWEKSGTWLWVVMNSKHSKRFFLAFTSLCLMSSWALGDAVMRTTSYLKYSWTKSFEDEADPTPCICSNAGPNVAQMMGRVNKERLGEYLGKSSARRLPMIDTLQLLRGETLTGPPDARVRAGAATSMPAASSHSENIAVSLQTGPGAGESKSTF